ncbi:tyrosine-type recombinase/integrase [Bacillus atrophaeus]|uniref:tyrosine-type recombinase/integrase n=1 Tax=Bacillus atrophaeus TaxID=1452 RepID=UPI00227FD68D|nr:tyrosine-type recombinase/integrase [Bacillus atrophaeus]MCY8518545.1 site-specific integrase [Bacillus atrophaeus]
MSKSSSFKLISSTSSSRPQNSENKNIIDYSEVIGDHKRIIEHYLISKKLRNHSPTTIKGTSSVLRRFFDIVRKPCWEITINDVNDYHSGLIDAGLSHSTRRGYINIIMNFYNFFIDHPEIPQNSLELQAGKQLERADIKYNVKLIQPVDKWFVQKHVTDDIAVETSIPSKDNMRSFFKTLRNSAFTSVKPLVINRDYAMFRLMYHTGLRLSELMMLDVRDISFERGTIHVRYGKGSNGSGKKERWVPGSLYNLESVLSIYLKQVRPHFLNAEKEKALFLSEHGKRISTTTIKNRLIEALQKCEQEKLFIPHFTCHDFRRSFATHFYEENPTKIEAIRHILGHSLLGTTQRYLKPSKEFLKEQLDDVTNGNFNKLIGDINND